MRSQRRIPGFKRKPMSTAVLTEIEQCITREMARYGVSRSFVIANALAYTFSIDFESYLPEKESKNGPRAVREGRKTLRRA